MAFYMTQTYSIGFINYSEKKLIKIEPLVADLQTCKLCACFGKVRSSCKNVPAVWTPLPSWVFWGKKWLFDLSWGCLIVFYMCLAQHYPWQVCTIKLHLTTWLTDLEEFESVRNIYMQSACTKITYFTSKTDFLSYLPDFRMYCIFLSPELEKLKISHIAP